VDDPNFTRKRLVSQGFALESNRRINVLRIDELASVDNVVDLGSAISTSDSGATPLV
jgi:hypothetical protein